MDAKLTELLTWLQQTTEGATEFAVAQAPLVAQELLRYKMVGACIWFCVGVFWLIIMLLLLIYMHRLDIKKGHRCDLLADVALLGLPATVGGILPIAFSLATIIKLTLAPRVYVLEWVMAKIGG